MEVKPEEKKALTDEEKKEVINQEYKRLKEKYGFTDEEVKKFESWKEEESLECTIKDFLRFLKYIEFDKEFEKIKDEVCQFPESSEEELEQEEETKQHVTLTDRVKVSLSFSIIDLAKAVKNMKEPIDIVFVDETVGSIYARNLQFLKELEGAEKPEPEENKKEVTRF